MRFFGITDRITSAFRSLRTGKGYIAAQIKRWSRNWKPSGGSPDGEILNDLTRLRERSRDLYKNNAVGGGALDLLVSNVIGRGLKMQSAMDRKIIQDFNGWSDEETNEILDDLERRIETGFDQWASSLQSDFHGEASFYENQALAFLSVLQSGEVFMTTPMKKHFGAPYRLRIGLIEADQVETPYGVKNSRRNRAGIETLADGTPIAYWVNRNQEKWPQEMQRIQKFGDFSGRQLIYHLFKRQRPGQSRGVPFLARVTEEIRKTGLYKKSELTAAEVSSFFTVFIETDTGEGLNKSNGIVEAAGSQTQEEIEDEGRNYPMTAGMINELRPGEKISTANPTRPNTNYEPFMTAMFREIGMGTGIPFEILVRHFTSSFTAARAARVEFQKVINVYRDWFKLRMCQPVFREWLVDEILSGRILAPGFFESIEVQQAYLGTIWAGAPLGMIDPQKEVAAAFDSAKKGFTTMTQVTAEVFGNDYSRVLAVQEREKKLREKHGIISEIDLLPGSVQLSDEVDKLAAEKEENAIAVGE